MHIMPGGPKAEAERGGTRPLRVLAISHSATTNGAGRRRYDLIADDPRFSLTLAVPRVWNEYGRAFPAEASTSGLRLRIEPVRLTRGGPAKWYFHHYPRLSALLSELRPDVVHLWEEPWSIAALQAAWLRDRLLPNAALLLETDQNILRRLPPGFEQVRRHTLARTDLLVARGQDALDVCRRCGFTGPSAFVEYGIADDVFYPRDREDERLNFGIGGFTIGYVGRLVPEKGLLDVLDAMARCRSPVRFVLLGEGPQKPQLEARAQALGLAERVRFLPPCPPDGVARLISALDVLVLPSRTTRTWKEQFGRVIMEAHACGVPVLGSSSGSIPSVVGNGGWIVPEGDVEALARSLDHLAAAPGEVAAAGARGQHAACNRFAFSAVATALGDAWIKGVAARAARRAAPPA